MHIRLHTLHHEKHVDTSLPLSDSLSKTNQFPVVKGMWDIGKGGENILTSSGRLASGAMSCTAVSLCCAVVKENGLHNRGACIHRS